MSLYCTRYFCSLGLHCSSLRFTTLQNRGTFYESHQFFTSLPLHFMTPLRITSLSYTPHVTSRMYTQSPLEFTLLVTIFLTLFLKVLNLRGKTLVSLQVIDSSFLLSFLQGGSNMTRTNCGLFTHKSSRSYLNHLVQMNICQYLFIVLNPLSKSA
jgi:hypothetical protein